MPKQTLLERLKSNHWLSGFFAAIALIGIADQIFKFETFLDFTHALITRWNELLAIPLSKISSLLNWSLPFKFHWSTVEQNLMILVPIMLVGIISAATVSDDNQQLNIGDRQLTFVENGQAKFTLLGSVLFSLAACIYALSLGFQDAGTQFTRPLFAPEWSWQYAETVFGFVVNSIIGVVCVLAIFMYNQAYARAIVFVILFVLTLELAYHIPAIQAWLQPWIDGVAQSTEI